MTPITYTTDPHGLRWTCGTCWASGVDWHEPFARRDAREHVCEPVVQIVPIPQGWRVVCAACDTQTATWQREVAERLRDTHQCPRGWDGGAA